MKKWHFSRIFPKQNKFQNNEQGIQRIQGPVATSLWHTESSIINGLKGIL